MKDEHEKVSDDEELLRRILNRQDYYKPELPRPVLYAAFKPTEKDVDGISLYRAQCGATPAEVANSPDLQKTYLVAGLAAKEIIAIDINGPGLTIEPTPQGVGPRGHASIPELNAAFSEIRQEPLPVACDSPRRTCRKKDCVQTLAVSFGSELYQLPLASRLYCSSSLTWRFEQGASN